MPGPATLDVPPGRPDSEASGKWLAGQDMP